MKCVYCGKETDTLTSADKPICRQCAEEHGFSACTEMGKYIMGKDFVCNHICDACDFSERRADI